MRQSGNADEPERKRRWKGELEVNAQRIRDEMAQNSAKIIALQTQAQLGLDLTEVEEKMNQLERRWVPTLVHDGSYICTGGELARRRKDE